MGALKGVRNYKPYGDHARRILEAIGAIGAMELWSGAERRAPALRDDEELGRAELELCAPPRLTHSDYFRCCNCAAIFSAWRRTRSKLRPAIFLSSGVL